MGGMGWAGSYFGQGERLVLPRRGNLAVTNDTLFRFRGSRKEHKTSAS